MSLIKNSIYNLGGYIIPTLIAVPSLGIIARQLGTESFGIFTLAFAFVGYASIFDAGITRAVIREISIFRDDSDEQIRILSTSTVIVFTLGLFSSLLLFFFSDSLISLLKVSPSHITNATLSFKLLSLIIPVYLINQIYLAYLEGQEKFANINIQRSITSSFLALAPALASFVSPTLLSAVVGLIIARVFSLVFTYFICRNIIKDIKFKFYKTTFVRLIKYGSWLTLSNIINPFMTYFDRFVISSIMGASKIAFYAAPAEGVARLINIPCALTRALFPKLSYANNKEERLKLEKKSYAIISLLCIPIVVIGAIFSKFIMTIWMGADYAFAASTILQILLIGFYFNSIAQIPYSSLQAAGRSKATAVIHCIEILPYLCLLYVLTKLYGLEGTAAAWSTRTFLDFILLFYVSRKNESY